MFFYGIIIILALLPQVRTNIIQNGDCQGHKVSKQFQGEYYSWYSSDSIWYTPTFGASMQFKHKTNPIGTHVIELNSFMPYDLCQRVSLEVNKIYKLTYDLLTQRDMKNVNYYVKINGIVMQTTKITTPNSFGSGQLIFTATSISNSVCFSQTHTNMNIFDLLMTCCLGACIDNITLVSLQQNLSDQNQTLPNVSNASTVRNQSQTFLNNSQLIQANNISNILQQDAAFSNNQIVHHYFYINFESKISDLWDQINLYANCTLQPYAFNVIKNYGYIYLQNQLQQDVEFTTYGSDNKFLISIKPNRNYNIQKITLAIQYTYRIDQNQRFHFFIYIDNKRIQIEFLTNQQKKVRQKLEDMAILTGQIVQKINFFTSATFSSYFVLSLFNFWYIILMYNFLPISTVPRFTRNLFEKILIFLYRKGSIIGFLTQKIGIPQDVFEVQFEDSIPQLMNKFEQGYAWFGSFDLSSKFFVNNVESFILILFLIAKIHIVKFFIYLLPKKFKSQLGLSINYSKIIYGELITISPFSVLSIMHWLEHSLQKCNQKLQKSVQIIFMFPCFMIYALWLLSQVKKNKKHKQQILRNSNRIYRNQQYLSNLQEKNETFCLCFQYILNFSIPFLVYFRQVFLFLFVNSIIIIYRIINIGGRIKKIQMFNRIFYLIMALIWVIFHLLYVFLAIVEFLQYSSLNHKLFEASPIYCGFGILGLFLTGGLIEILRFLFQILETIIRGTRQVLKYFCIKQNSISPEINQQKNDKNNIEISFQQDFPLPLCMNSDQSRRKTKKKFNIQKQASRQTKIKPKKTMKKIKLTVAPKKQFTHQQQNKKIQKINKMNSLKGKQKKSYKKFQRLKILFFNSQH